MGMDLEGLSSVIKEEDLEIIRAQAGFLAGAKFRVPDEGECPKDCPSRYVVFYSYPFSIGFRFPFSKMVRDMLIALEFSPGHPTFLETL